VTFGTTVCKKIVEQNSHSCYDNCKDQNPNDLPDNPEYQFKSKKRQNDRRNNKEKDLPEIWTGVVVD
jgi:hypothetical protein